MRATRSPALSLLSLALLLVAAPAGAQREEQPAAPPSVDESMSNCRRSGGWDDDRERHCEIRDTRISAPIRLRVDAGPNGSVRIRGWDGPDVLVRAIVRTEARSIEEAREIAKEIDVVTGSGTVRADGPRWNSSWNGRRRSWMVSYDIWVPRQLNIDSETTNGSIRVTDVRGTLRAETTNGGIELTDVAGDVRTRTTNGSVHVRVAQSRWEGTGLDAQTTNGGVTLSLPADFNARLEAETTNGGFRFDFPITLQGRIGRRISTTLGEGGPLVRVATTNGGVRIVRR